MENVFNFEMKYVGDSRGYFFSGESKWEDSDLIRGLGRVRFLGDVIEEIDSELEGWGWRKGMSVREVVDWIESDCIGGGEEEMVELKINGKVVYLNKVEKELEWDNSEELEEMGMDWMDVIGEDVLMDIWNMSEEEKKEKFWKIEEIEKML